MHVEITSVMISYASGREIRPVSLREDFRVESSTNDIYSPTRIGICEIRGGMERISLGASYVEHIVASNEYLAEIARQLTLDVLLAVGQLQ